VLFVEVDNNITDRYERDSSGLNIEIDPGYDNFIKSANPAIQAQFMAAKHGELVLVTGVPRNGGRNIRVLTIRVLRAAPPPVINVVVDNTVSDPVVELETTVLNGLQAA
jgi:hypothetical protein